MNSKLLLRLLFVSILFSFTKANETNLGPGDDEVQLTISDIINPGTAGAYIDVSFNLEYLDANEFDFIDYIEIDMYPDGGSATGLIYLRKENSNGNLEPYSDTHDLNANNFSFIKTGYRVFYNNVRGSSNTTDGTGVTYHVSQSDDSNHVRQHRITFSIPIYKLNRMKDLNNMRLRVRGRLRDRNSSGESNDVFDTQEKDFTINEEDNNGADELDFSVERFPNQGFNRLKFRIEKYSDEAVYDHLACLEIGREVFSGSSKISDTSIGTLNHTAASLGCSDFSSSSADNINFTGVNGDTYRFSGTSNLFIDKNTSTNTYYTRLDNDNNGNDDDVYVYIDHYVNNSDRENDIHYYVSGSYYGRDFSNQSKKTIRWSENRPEKVNISDDYTIPDTQLNTVAVSSTSNCAVDISWTDAATYGDALRNYIYIYRNNTYLDKVARNSSNGTYTDNTIEAGVTYNYQIVNVYERDKFGNFEGKKSASLSAKIDLLQSPSGLASQQSGCDGNIDITWSYSNNPGNFVLQRKTATTNFITLSDTIDGALRTYTDNNNIVENEVYYYRIAAVADASKCNALGEFSPILTHSEDQIDITPIFDNNSNDVEASKGYFDNRTELNWNPDFTTEQFINQYKVYTRELGSTISPKLLTTLDINNKTYNDVNGNAGTIYEYFIVAERVVETVCGRQVTASYPIDALNNTITPENLPNGVAYDIGLRVASGVINGNISFEGGTAVKDVKVIAEKQGKTNGKSLYFNGSNSYVNVAHNSTLVPTDEITISAWIKPENLDKFSVILEKQVSYGFHVSTNGSIYFYIKDQNDDEHEARTTAGVIKAGQWQNITGVFDKNTRKIAMYVNGEKKAENILPNSVTSMSSGSHAFPFTLGRQHGSQNHYFQGYIDEIKFYNKALSDEEVARESARFSDTDAEELKVYLKIFEGQGNTVYDVAHEGDNYFKNDGDLNNVVFSSDVPSQTQLGSAGYTDEFGNYTIFAVEYNNTGENFNIIPTATIGGAIHEFNPSRKTVFIGEGSKVINGQDFEDISSFRFSGYIRFDFEDTVGSSTKTSGSQGVQLLLDGTDNIFGDDGRIFETDEDGFFDVDIPIGNHYITFIKQGHTFTNGRFPETETHNFQADVTGLEITDTTSLILSGKISGGLEEANKKLFMPNNPSINTIGQAEFTITSEDGKIVRKIVSDSTTGEYTIQLPPKKYTSTSVVYTSNQSEIINSGDITPIDLQQSETYYLTYEKDTIYNNGVVVDIDSTSYNLRKDFIFRTNATLLVTSEDDDTDLKKTGEDSFSFKEDNDTYNDIDVSSLNFPVYIPRDSIPYRYKLKAIENYTNIDNNKTFTSSVPGGEVQVFNGVGFTVTQGNDGKLVFGNPNDDRLLLDNNGEFLYEFVVREANTSINTSSGQEHLSFTKQIGFALNINGQTTSWPNASDSNERQYAYVFGSKVIENQNSFVTKAPETVDFILRDPPGSNSYAYLESGQEFSTTQEIGHGSFQNSSGSLSLGHSIYFSTPFVGFGVNIEAFATAGVNATREVSEGQSLTSTVSFNETIETNADPNQVGRSDIFVARSENLETQFAFTVSPLPLNLCGTDNCFGPVMTDEKGNQYKLARILQASTKPTDAPTYIIYSQNHIENVLIPDLIDLRNSVFTKSGSRYVSKLPLSDPNFGTNNDDIVWGTSKTSETPIKTERNLDFDGPSYRFTPLNVKEPDTIRAFNQQIRLWKDALAKNEVDKWMAKNYRSKENISISGGSKIEKSESNSTTDVSYISFERTTSGVLETDLLIAGFPGGPPPPVTYFSLSSSNEWGDKRSSNFTDENTTSRTVGYVLHDADEDDFISIDVFKGTGNDGPIFITKGGQTMCPYQDKTTVKYATPFYLQNLDTIVTNDIKNLKERINSLKIIEGEVLSEIKDRINNSLKKDKKKYEDEIEYLEDYKNRIETLITQINNGEVILDAATVQREKPELLINGAKTAQAFNVPADEAANFNLSLINDSQSGDAQFYAVQALDETNPNGLEMTIDGQSINSAREFLVQGGGGIQKVLKVRRGPNHYDYENVGIVIKSTCQADPTSNDAVISDTIYFNAKFLPICTELKINSPNNNWTVNNSFDNKLPVTIGDYDVNIAGFEEIKIQYKTSSSANWTLLTTYYRNEDIRTANGGTSDDPLLPTNGNSFTYEWDLGSLPDGDYDIRAVSKCTLAETETEIYSGRIDRTNPTPFGLPQPSDGILSPGEEASVQFNETINENLLSPANFDIRGVLNGGEIRHTESVSFSGNNNSFVEVEEISFVNQPFTIDFYAKRDTNNQKQILVSQGSTESDELEIGFNTANQIYFTLGGKTVTGTTAINNNWHHYAFTYDPSNTDLTIYYDATLEAIDNSFEVEVNHSESLFIGKSARTATNAFDGKVHELRLWSKPLSVGEVNIYAVQRLIGNEAGLLHNWQMEEANGELVLDKVRGKHAKMNAEWHISPLGYALELFGTSDQANTTPISFDNESDFTIEFWFKTSGTNQVLLSNGKGDGTDDNTSGWTIGINNSRNIYAQSNGEIMASIATVSPNKWTHVAISHNARGNSVLYVDAKEEAKIDASLLDGFGGSELSFGQQIWYVTSVKNSGSYFTGHLDEIRIWNAAVKQNQLSRDRYNMLTGDEPGLVRYYSFDTYTENAGLFSVTSTFANKTADAIANETITTTGASTLNQDTPTIRLPRPVEKVNFSYVVNNDKIIITLNEEASKIENVALDFTVTNVKDLNGNSIQSPIKWTAFIDRNQVIWQDNSFDLATDYETELVFQTNVVNNSGESKIFEITNIPFWLEVSPTSGTVGPLTTTPITFKVNEDVNVGSYTEDVLLTTSDFGFAEKLNINVNVKKALPEDWTINPTDFEFSMNVIGQISIDGSISRDENNLLGVFVNDECRGIAKLTYLNAYDNYQAFLAIYSNTSFGEEMEFRVWEHDKGIVHSSLSHNLSSSQFTADTYQGSAINPKLFSTTNIISGSVDVVDGWRWISFNLNGADLSSTTNLLANLNPANGDIIKTRVNVADGSGGFTQQSLFDTYSTAANIWFGSLSNNGGLETGLLYKVKLSENDKIKYQGAITNPLNSPLNIVSGWNYLGYLGLANIPINEALANFNAAPGDLIKSQYFSAIYDTNFGWLGTLKILTPNEGYMMRATNAQSFKFPSFNSTAKTAKTKTAEKTSNVMAKSPWTISAKDYESNMTIVAQINHDELNKNDGVLGAFVNGICKGFAAPIYNENIDKNIYLLNIGDRDKNSLIEFKYLDFTTGIVYNINEISNYKDDLQEGKLKEPKLLTIKKGELVGDLIIKMYPNPVKDKLQIMLPLQNEGSVQIQLFDVNGKTLYIQKLETFKRGWHKFEINTSRVSNGIYNVMIISNGKLINKKIVISK